MSDNHLKRGYSYLFSKHVQQAKDKFDFDFLISGNAVTDDPEIHWFEYAEQIL